MENFKFGDLSVGYLDAETEATYNEGIFGDIFYDLNNTLEKLQNLSNPLSILIGRKGVGKSAYAARLGMLNTNIQRAYMIKLSDVSYNDFTKISDNKNNVIGAQRYLHVWIILLLSSVIKELREEDVKNKKLLKRLKSLVSELGLSSEDSLVRDIITAAKKDFKVRISSLEVEVFHEGEDNSGKIRKFNGITDFANYLCDNFEKLQIKTKILPVIDGVDDVLRTKKDIRDILSGLVRAIHTINQSNFKKNSLKFILVIREDIVKSINDPDMNKIIRDRSSQLDWYTNGSGTDKLLVVFGKRLATNRYLSTMTAKEIWEGLFPFKIGRGSGDSWNYFLEYTMYRPRDVVQFINQFVNNYPENEEVTREMFKDELRKFSQDYFYEEMKNELLGFLPDDVIEKLFEILQKVGSRNRDNFSFQDFVKEFENYFSNYTQEDIKNYLTILFNAGYVGMLRDVNRGRGNNRTYVNFKHKDPRLTIDFSSKFIIHKGLFSALNI
ncbi:P-loop ATPase, Sll1717 family [Streptococcus equinus]|uniref:P-loop ATPase, Sll1717 family n=1 Tax=Streptococcus equinus TaxID=1335 RepID=UPI0008D8205A|nr:hypothetical protein [Streptococcus equinus]SEK85006.1 hypothetical protein SAMN05216373_1083 [Streptococcus equinus]